MTLPAGDIDCADDAAPRDVEQRPMPAAREPGPPSGGPPMLSGMERRGLSSHRPPPVVTWDAARRGRAVPGIGVAPLVHQSFAVTAAGPAHAPCCGPALTVRLRHWARAHRRSPPVARATDSVARICDLVANECATVGYGLGNASEQHRRHVLASGTGGPNRGGGCAWTNQRSASSARSMSGGTVNRLTWDNAASA